MFNVIYVYVNVYELKLVQLSPLIDCAVAISQGLITDTLENSGERYAESQSTSYVQRGKMGNTSRHHVITRQSSLAQ